MDCLLCADLESELDRQEHRHAQALGMLAYHTVHDAPADELNQIRTAEREARTDADLARAELAAHRRNHARQN